MQATFDADLFPGCLSAESLFLYRYDDRIHHLATALHLVMTSLLKL